MTAPFAITVLGAGTTAPSATLSWIKPTQNADGTPLTNLAGYIVRYGTNVGALHRASIGVLAEYHAVGNRRSVAGNWYFEVAAVNTTDTESAFSSAVSEAFP